MSLQTLLAMNFIKGIAESDAAGQICLLLLTGISVVSLAIIYWKWGQIRRARSQNGYFERHVKKDGTWEGLFLASKKFPHAPMAKLIKEAYVECKVENWFQGRKMLDLPDRIDFASRSITNSLSRIILKEESHLQSHLVSLSTITTIAPFLGLLGTVWGVMASFQSIGTAGSAALSALAPGISTALMTTIFGLLAAIPALISYNYFIREINKIAEGMETFSTEIEGAVRRQLVMDEERSRK